LEFVGEEVGLFPGGEVAALGGLVEVDQGGIGLLDPAAGAVKISSGKLVKPTGTWTGGGGWPAVAAWVRPLSQ
jgi:hypothetical protein